jgi:DegV family protein with EDD domain
MTKSPPIAIVADTGCDLPPAVLTRYRIGQVSLTARFGEYELLDTSETRSEFWDLYDISQPPQSAAPAPAAWTDAYETALQRADDVIAITITGKHSSTFNSAVVAASQFDGRVHVFDSWSLSLGEGLLTLHAAQWAEAGHGVANILAALTSWRERMRVFILLDTVEAIQRGGRVAPIMSAIKRVSTMFSIKPILTIREGTLSLDSIVRSRKKGFNRLVSSLDGHQVEALAVAHTRNPEQAQRLADVIARDADYPRADLMVVEAGPALAVHAGPGVLGMGFVEKPSA